ncbi:unnamed protein product [Protopolystoma xenopodis]|uniref:Uncharacterized protein n=1 Tax=Protopolystoma xenopodis TaxID=117903 RepID=A0A448X7Q1_9PLAT|nr:unnamed protein product [Protopolystoma xenopodis]
MVYIEHEGVLPVPFNLLPSHEALSTLYNRLRGNRSPRRPFDKVSNPCGLTLSRPVGRTTSACGRKGDKGRRRAGENQVKLKQLVGPEAWGKLARKGDWQQQDQPPVGTMGPRTISADCDQRNHSSAGQRADSWASIQLDDYDSERQRRKASVRKMSGKRSKA